MLNQIVIRPESETHPYGEWPQECLWIVHGHVDVETPKRPTPEALGDSCRIAERGAGHVEPAPVTETGRFGDQRVTLPSQANYGRT